MPLAVALQSQEPRGSAALIHFQKQPFTVLISARIRQSCLDCNRCKLAHRVRSEEHTSELQSLMRISSAVFCLKKKKNTSKKSMTSTPARHMYSSTDTQTCTYTHHTKN